MSSTILKSKPIILPTELGPCQNFDPFFLSLPPAPLTLITPVFDTKIPIINSFDDTHVDLTDILEHVDDDNITASDRVEYVLSLFEEE